MDVQRMRTSRQQLIEEPTTLADRMANGAGADAEPGRELALEVNVDAIVKPLEDLRVVRGLCYWTDVATAIGEIRRSLRSLGPSVCKTCNGHGIIGGMYRVGDGDVDGWEKPCPDCEPSPQAQSSELSRRLEEFLKENEDCFFDCEIQTVKDAIRALSSPNHADAGKVEGDGCIGEWKEIEVSYPLKGRRKTPAYFPATGEACEVSGPNCDDDNGFTWGKTTVLWQNQMFVLYGNDGYWPVLHKHEHVLFRPLPSAPASEDAE